jgi:aspartate aminotransferase
MSQIRSRIDFDDERFLMFELDKLAYLKEKKGEEVIRMTLGKSELPVNQSIVEAIVDAARDYEKYSRVFPAGLPELREALADHHNRTFGTCFDSENVVVGCGTSSIFRNLFQILCAAGDEALLPHPYYPLYRFSAKLAGAAVRHYTIGLDDMRIDFDSFRENFTDKTRIVVFNSPGNPLGNVVDEEDIRRIDEIVDGRAVIINDAIYENMYFDEPPHSALQLQGLRSTFITTNAFSKGYRMYARRVGYCIVPDELVTPLTVIQHHTLLTLDPIAQYGAIEALKHGKDVEYLTQIYKQRRDYAVEKFEGSREIRALPARGSFYMTLDCSTYMNNREIKSGYSLAKDIIKKRNVATVPGSDFGIPQTQRLSYSTHRWNEGIDRLADYFAVS